MRGRAALLVGTDWLTELVRYNLPDGAEPDGTDEDGNDRFRISIPLDEHGFFGRECPSCQRASSSVALVMSTGRENDRMISLRSTSATSRVPLPA